MLAWHAFVSDDRTPATGKPCGWPQRLALPTSAVGCVPPCQLPGLPCNNDHSGLATLPAWRLTPSAPKGLRWPACTYHVAHDIKRLAPPAAWNLVGSTASPSTFTVQGWHHLKASVTEDQTACAAQLWEMRWVCFGCALLAGAWPGDVAGCTSEKALALQGRVGHTECA
jgi:hypothetical protein